MIRFGSFLYSQTESWRQGISPFFSSLFSRTPIEEAPHDSPSEQATSQFSNSFEPAPINDGNLRARRLKSTHSLAGLVDSTRTCELVRPRPSEFSDVLESTGSSDSFKNFSPALTETRCESDEKETRPAWDRLSPEPEDTNSLTDEQHLLPSLQSQRLTWKERRTLMSRPPLETLLENPEEEAPDTSSS